MKSFEERLREESEAWVGDGVITPAQRATLLQRHPAGEGGGRFVAILGMVGGGLLLAGVCLLISANWRDIGDWMKIGGLVALLAGAYAAGWRMKISPGNHPWIGDAFFMVGAGLFIAGIALVSQIFHLNSRPATGALAWWMGIVAVPWLVRSKGAQVVSLLAFLVWVGMEFATRDGWLALAHEVRSHGNEMQMVAAMTVLGLIVWLAGSALRDTRHQGFVSLHETWGSILFCSGLYLVGFLRHTWSWRAPEDALRLAPACFLGGLLLAVATLAWRNSRREVLSMSLWQALGLVPVVAVLIAWNVGDHGWLWSATAWTALFVLNVFMIRAGLAGGRESWVNIGMAFIALNIVTRYFDLFGTMMEGGVFFVVSGVIVLTLGIYLERKRRAWLHAMRVGKEVA